MGSTFPVKGIGVASIIVTLSVEVVSFAIVVIMVNPRIAMCWVHLDRIHVTAVAITVNKCEAFTSCATLPSEIWAIIALVIP